MASQEQNAVLSRELDAKNGQIRELQAQLATSQETIDRLSSRSLFDRIFKRSLPPCKLKYKTTGKRPYSKGI